MLIKTFSFCLHCTLMLIGRYGYRPGTPVLLPCKNSCNCSLRQLIHEVKFAIEKRTASMYKVFISDILLIRYFSTDIRTHVPDVFEKCYY